VHVQTWVNSCLVIRQSIGRRFYPSRRIKNPCKDLELIVHPTTSNEIAKATSGLSMHRYPITPGKRGSAQPLNGFLHTSRTVQKSRTRTLPKIIFKLPLTTHLLHKGTVSAIQHENVRTGKGLHLLRFGVGVTGRDAFGRVVIAVAKGRLRVVQILRNRSTVTGHSKQCLTVVVTVFAKERVWDLLGCY